MPTKTKYIARFLLSDVYDEELQKRFHNSRLLSSYPKGKDAYEIHTSGICHDSLHIVLLSPILHPNMPLDELMTKKGRENCNINSIYNGTQECRNLINGG